VHIIDDDAAVRRSLERLLQSAEFETTSYASASAFLEDLDRFSGGCLLLDIWMPGMDGLALQARLNELGVRPPTIVMTALGDVGTAVRAMKAGAVDFIEKPFDQERLLSAVESAMSHVAPDWNAEAAEAVKRLAMLSPRERTVLDALVAGQTTKQIAYNLGISVRTVEGHRARMLERLGTRGIAEAVRVGVMAILAPAAPSP
jgi:two-component system response regulator FixJ